MRKLSPSDFFNCKNRPGRYRRAAAHTDCGRAPRRAGSGPASIRLRRTDGLERAPDHLALRNNLAMSLALGGEYADAIEILRQVTNSPSATVPNRNNLAEVLGMMGRYDDAASLLSRDLNREEVKNNSDFYRSHLPLDSRQRARRIYSVSPAK